MSNRIGQGKAGPGRRTGKAGKQLFTIMGKINKDTLEAIAKKYKKNKYGRRLLTPLDVMVELMNDKNQTERIQLDAAKAAAPYFHWAMPTPDEIKAHEEEANGKSDAPSVTINVLTKDGIVEQSQATAPEEAPVEEKSSA